MIRNLATIAALQCLLAGTAASAQEVCATCKWSDRGDRFEGVEDREQVSGGSFELLSVHYLRPPEPGEGDSLHLLFWLPEPRELDEIRVSQPARYYKMEPKLKQYGQGLQDFTWPRGEVIDPLGLSPDALYARIRSGDVYFPALLSPHRPAAPPGGYAFVFESGAGIDADCTIARQDDGTSEEVRTFECFEEFGGTIAIEWDGLDAAGGAVADGLYVLRVEGDMLAETIRPLETHVVFRHRQRLEE